MPANHFKVDGTRVDSFDEFLRAEKSNSWNSLLYYPDYFGPDSRDHYIFEAKEFVDVSFKDSDLVKVKFIRCKFIRCLFIGAKSNFCDFVDCEFVSTNTLKWKINSSLIDPEQFDKNFDLVNDTNIAIDLYHSLYKCSVEEHQPEYAVESLYRMREAEFKHLDSQLKRETITRKEYYSKKARTFLHREISGYGLRFGKIARFAAVVTLFFTMLNWLFGGFIFEDGKVDGIVDAFYFTVITMTTLGFGDITPVTAIGKILVSFQAIAGFSVVTVALAGVANKAIRGN
jgi:hypothetical protein